MTIIGNPTVVGNYPGWNMDEFVALLDANPDADLPLGVTTTKESFFEGVIFHNMNDYVDWELNTADFDNDNFISLLQAADMLPPNTSGDWNDMAQTAEMIAANRQLMQIIYFGDFSLFFLMYKAMFGGDFVFKGYPAENRIGNMLYPQGGIAITTVSKNKDAAWEFIRSFLTPEYARKYIDIRFPVIKTVFYEMLDDAMTEPWLNEVSLNGVSFEVVALTEQDTDRILDMFDRVSDTDGWEPGLRNIINEVASDFFNGRVSAYDAAGIIQNRASIFMSEQVR